MQKALAIKQNYARFSLFRNKFSHYLAHKKQSAITWHTKSNLPLIKPAIETKLHQFIKHKIIKTPEVYFHAIGGIGVIARDSKIFVADKLSETNKRQLNSLNVNWVELRSENGFQKFAEVLDTLKILHSEMLEVNDENLEKIFVEILN